MRWYINSRGVAYNLNLFFSIRPSPTDNDIVGLLLLTETTLRAPNANIVKEITIERVPLALTAKFMDWLLRDYTLTKTLLKWEEFNSLFVGKKLKWEELTNLFPDKKEKP